MIFTPKLIAIPLAASALLLTGCSVNAPVGPFDIHDNTVNQPSVTIPSDSLNDFPQAPNPLPSNDPNGLQDLPEPWSENSVATPEPVPLPTPIS